MSFILYLGSTVAAAAANTMQPGAGRARKLLLDGVLTAHPSSVVVWAE
jgi:hypothetical protein